MEAAEHKLKTILDIAIGLSKETDNKGHWHAAACEHAQAIDKYIYFYNNERYQLRLNCMTPMEYHAAFAA